MITFSVARSGDTLPSSGTGILVPLGTSWSGDGSMMTTAVTFLDRKWPHLRRDDDVLLRAHVGRIDDLRWDELNDEELVARVSAELQFLLVDLRHPNDVLVQRWPEGLPQYYLGHETMVTQGARRPRRDRRRRSAATRTTASACRRASAPGDGPDVTRSSMVHQLRPLRSYR